MNSFYYCQHLPTLSLEVLYFLKLCAIHKIQQFPWSTLFFFWYRKLVLYPSPKIFTTSITIVTMVQRTPTYIGAKPETDPVAQFFNTWLPACLAQPINRWKAVLLGFFFYLWCTTFPNKAKKFVKGVMYNEVKSVMSVEEFDKHFTPPYNPWQQRLRILWDYIFSKDKS